MQDFDELLKGMHDRNLKLVMDLVVNHSSDEHEWFKQSRSSRDNPYRDYYHWWPAEKGKPSPRRSFFDVNGDAWKFDEQTNSYYQAIRQQNKCAFDALTANGIRQVCFKASSAYKCDGQQS